ncbi:MAG TPA: adenosine deaminase [Spirochaetia bacterium]|nr:adenosine deaminase [Spirochaetia bacterium]
MNNQLTLTREQKKFRTLLKDIPKTEIHLHLEGLASVDTIWQLMSEHHIPVNGVKSKADLQGKFQIKSLDEFIALFIDVIQNCFQENKDFDYLIEDARSYLTRNNVAYAEIFFAPTKFLLNGFTFESMVEKLEAGAQSLAKESNIAVRYIIDVSRSYGTENAMKNLDLTLANRSNTIIGIGLGGAELHGPAKEYRRVFEKAAASGLKVVAHAGEDVGPKSIWDTLKLLKVNRIGHGISAIEDTKLMDFLRDSQIPLEVCPTSNLFTRKYATSLKDHPIRAFFDHGMNVTVNTDDPTLFDVDLIDEYMKLYTNEIFSADEILQLVKNGIFATFMPQPEKDALWSSVEARTAELRSS